MQIYKTIYACGAANAGQHLHKLHLLKYFNLTEDILDAFRNLHSTILLVYTFCY